MKVLTANRLSDGRVIYVGVAGRPVSSFRQAARFAGETADRALERALLEPSEFVGPYLVEVEVHGPSGRDRLKETIRAQGPTVGHSLDHA
ncbi:DUF2849 domain-containing protein [Brevundimonas sp.]|uniref:DUF2849 domain-containing protein n=1 Tax=Brevundimonas sp. TaxID=1871086 RepID=UPI00286A5658|nr:DUF2849 domain-containing protein [Brevundimonas sp.]